MVPPGQGKKEEMKQLLRPSILVICALTMLAGCGTPLTTVLGDAEHVRGYDYLKGKEAEESGYGLYSYLLFGSHPSDANRSLYRQVISATVRVEKIKDLEEEGFPRRQLNVTYIPVRDSFPNPETVLSPDQILTHYNFSRAAFLLMSVPGIQKTDSYIISSFHPLSGQKTPSGPFLVQNLSSIPPDRDDLIDLWIKTYFDRANQPNLWDKRTLSIVVAKLRTAIAVAAKGIPEVKKALKYWIKLLPST